ncbi:MAG: sulfite exporter TauE/SafE family protein [Myxococcota bacterium]
MTLDEIGPVLGSALVLGFFGSVHCLAMCGGIAGTLGQLRPAESWLGNWGRALLYSAGRVTSYALAGAVVGALGHRFAEQTGLQMALRLIAGALIVLFGLHVAGWWNGLAWTERAGAIAWRRLMPWARRLGEPDRAWKVFSLGMIWGWLPCGLVYAGLAGASASGGAGLGAAFMVCFGLGTLPALLPVSALSDRVGHVLRNRAARRAAGALLIAFGFVAVGGALMPMMNHEGMHRHQSGAAERMHGAHEMHEAGGAQGAHESMREVEGQEAAAPHPEAMSPPAVSGDPHHHGS